MHLLPPLSLFLFLLLSSSLFHTIQADWIVQEIYLEENCISLDKILVQELSTCYSDGYESNKYEINDSGLLLHKLCSDDDECTRCSFDGPPQSVDSDLCQYEEEDDSYFKQFVSSDFPTNYDGTIIVSFRNNSICDGDLSEIYISPGPCDERACDDLGFQQYCKLPPFLGGPTDSPTTQPTNGPTNGPTNNPTNYPNWLVREFYTADTNCNNQNNLLFAFVTDIDSCYVSKIGNSSVSYVLKENYVETWNCASLDCTSCINLAHRQQMGTCELYSTNFVFEGTAQNYVYLREYITQSYPFSLTANSNIAVEFKGDSCGGDINGVTITPGDCTNSCVWYTENYCIAPDYLLNNSAPTTPPSPSVSPSPSPSPSPSSSPSPSPSPSPTPPKGGLSGAAIFGIIVFVFLGLGVGAMIGYYFYQRKKNARTASYQDLRGYVQEL